MRKLGFLAILLLAACGQSSPPAGAPPSTGAPPPAGDAKSAANSAAYARDRDACRAQADEFTKTRRNVDDSRREVFSGTYERYGQTTLPRDMDNYGDSRRTDRIVASCMETRGWGQQPAWWQKIGS